MNNQRCDDRDPWKVVPYGDGGVCVKNSCDGRVIVQPMRGWDVAEAMAAELNEIYNEKHRTI